MNDYYMEKLEQGLYYQDKVMEKLYEVGLPLISYSSKKYQQMIGENKAGIEIKNDTKFSVTNNFYIEIAEKSDPSNPNYIPSGIYRNDNTWLYIMGDEKVFYIFSKKHLKFIHSKNKYKEVQTLTSKGFLLPKKDADLFYALNIIYF